MTYRLKGRPVELEIETDGGEYMVTVGYYEDGEMEDLTNEELDEALEANHGAICEGQMGTAIDRAHDSGDMER